MDKGKLFLSEEEMNFRLKSLMASDRSVAAAFHCCRTTDQLSGDQYRFRDSGLNVRHRSGTLRSIQLVPLLACMCLGSVLFSFILSDQVDGSGPPRFFQQTYLLLETRKKPSIYCTVKNNFALYIQNYFPELQRIIRLLVIIILFSSWRRRWVVGVSLHRLWPVPTRLAPAPSTAFHGIKDEIARTSFLMLYSTKEEPVFSYTLLIFNPAISFHKWYYFPLWHESGRPVENHGICCKDGHIHHLSLGLSCEHKWYFRSQNTFGHIFFV